MTRLERSILINVSTDAINAVTLDGTRLPEWYAGVEAVEVDDTYPEPGGVVNMTYKAAGITFKVDMTSQELARGDHMHLQMKGMITGTNHWSYKPEAGGTRVTVVFDYEMPGGALGAIANKLVVERMNAQNLEKSLENLKKLLEGG
jgi:uncharacterized membrane protein